MTAEETADPRVPVGPPRMAERVAATHWAATALGPAEEWPQSLRTALSICLASRFPMLIWWGPRFVTLYNDAYVPALGSKHPAALGAPATQVWPEAWSDLGPLAESVLAGGAATYSEDLLLFLRRHGYVEETYWTFSYSPIQDESGGVGGVFIAVNDTTTRVLGERRLHALRELGEVSAAAGAADACREAVGVLARHRHEVPYAMAYLGSRDGARLVAAYGVRRDSPGAPDALPHPSSGHTLWRVLNTGGAERSRGVTGRYPGCFEPGPIGDAVGDDALVLPLTEAGGTEPIGVLVLGVNPYRELDADYRAFFDLVARHVSTAVTDALAYEAERRRAEALAELDRAKTDFFSNISHEFRTPLTLIMGPLAELRAAPALAADTGLRTELDVVHRNTLRLGKLVNTLLEYARLQAGRVRTRFEPVDLAAATAELAAVFRSAVDRAGLTFTVDCPALDEPVYVDRDMWENVVLNLLSNALKFTFAGGITVRLRRDDGAAVLTVADTGTGIPAAELPRLFERFHRVEGSRARSGEGSGIGLAMVQELVGLHGGAITADSAVDAGTTFTVTLPLGADHLPQDRIASGTAQAHASAAAEPFVAEALRWLPEPAAASEASGSASVAGPAPHGQGRVLVADDNADMREYLARLLGPHHAVETVPDGDTALAAVRSRPPDLVVSDVMMPGTDGLELLAALRADPRTARVPVLLLSARAGQESAVEALAAGADDYLVKPFSGAELIARVGAHVQLGRVRREAEQRFTAMADLAPALIWVADAGGHRVFFNAGWQQFTGRDAAELGERWHASLHPQDRQRYLDAVAAATAEHRGWEIEYRVRRGGGAYHWLLEHAVPVGGPDGADGYVGSAVDINARHREAERHRLLAQVSGALDSESEAGAQLRRLARLLVDSRLADLCTIRRLDDAGVLHRVAAAALDPAAEALLTEMDPETVRAREAIESRRALLVAELPAGWHVEPGVGAAQAEQRARLPLRSVVTVPLTVRGRVLGVVVLGRGDDAPRYTEDDAELAEEIAARTGLALDNTLLLAEERATAVRLALLQHATAELSAATTPVQVAATALRHVRQLLGEGCMLSAFEVDVQERALTALALPDVEGSFRARWASIPLQAPMAITAAAREGRPIWIEDVTVSGAAGAEHEQTAEAMAALGLRGAVALPLRAADRVVGVIGAGFPEPRVLGPAERATLLALAEQCAQALDRARLYRAEHRIAATLQRSLLPQRLPEPDRLGLAARYLPGAEGAQAGGDWYDVVELDEHRIAIAVGDVVGQGPAAAAGMGRLSSVLSGYLLQGHGPAAALELLDRFAARIPDARASTAACVTLDARTGTVRWARAGHPPPLLAAADRVWFLDDDAGHGTVLGVPGRPPYTEGVTSIEPGTAVLLYTDGLVERRDEVVDAGLDRLADAVRRHRADPPELLAAHLLREVLHDTGHPDDIALIIARLRPAPLRLRLPARPAELPGLRRRLRGWAADSALADAATDDLQLALGEAVANAVEHAYGDGRTGEFECEVAWRAGAVHVRVRDFGRWRPQPADRGFRGRGMEVVRALAEDVAVQASEGGTTVRFRLAPPPAVVDRVRGGDVAVGVAGPAPAGIRVYAEPDGPRVEIRGELDLAAAESLRAELLEHLDHTRAGDVVTFDLRPTTYLASAGVGLLLHVAEHARSRGIALRVRTGPSSPPARVLALTGLDRLLPDPAPSG